jgi:hypothetical protein
VLGCVPAALVLRLVTKNWISIPFWDEWLTPGTQLTSWCNGTLTLTELFSQHNESRKFFPRLLYLFLARVAGWDVRHEMVCVFLSVCVLGFFLYQLLRRTPGVSPVAALTAWAVMMFLCFSPIQLENFLWGIQLETFFPGIAVVAAVTINLSALSLRSRALINATLALVASYTYANGLLLWLLAVPLSSASTPRRDKKVWYTVYCLVGALAIGGYFTGYSLPATLPKWTYRPLDLLHYIVLWVGAYFRSEITSPLIAGSIVLVLFFGTFGIAAVVLVRYRNWKVFYPWFAIAVYAGITGFVTAAGRAGFGINQAMDSRYTTFSLFFYLALVGMIFALYSFYLAKRTGIWRDTFLLILGAAIGIGSMAWLACYKQGVSGLVGHKQYRVKLKRALEWIDVVPDNPDLVLVFPWVDWLTNNTHALAKHRLLRLRFVAEPLASQVKQAPATASDANGELESCTLNPDYQLFITGWAWLPNQNRPADCVVIGVEDVAGNFKPVSVLETGERRQDLRDRFHVSTMYRAGFARAVRCERLLKEKLRIKAWAVDLKNQFAYPIAGSSDCSQSGANADHVNNPDQHATAY